MPLKRRPEGNVGAAAVNSRGRGNDQEKHRAPEGPSKRRVIWHWKSTAGLSPLLSSTNPFPLSGPSNANMYRPRSPSLAACTQQTSAVMRGRSAAVRRLAKNQKETR
jgi:hypothetical protein